MRVEITPKKTVAGSVTVWNEHGKDVDVVMDLKNLTFKEAYLDELFVFGVLNQLFLEEAKQAVKNWYKCLKPGGILFVIVDDFEYLTRGFVGGDMTIEQWNNEFAHVSYYTRDNMVKILSEAGFLDADQSIWFESPRLDPKLPPLFTKQHFELVISAKKHE